MRTKEEFIEDYQAYLVSYGIFLAEELVTVDWFNDYDTAGWVFRYRTKDVTNFFHIDEMPVIPDRDLAECVMQRWHDYFDEGWDY